MIIFFIFHVLFASMLAAGLAMIFGALSPWIAWVSLLFGAGVAWHVARLFNRAHPDIRFTLFADGNRGLIELILSAFVLYVATRHYMWLFFPLEHQWATLSAFNVGDLPLHINYIRFIAQGGHFPPVDPIFAAEPLRYPFGVDFYSALWESIGVGLRSHLFLVGICGTVASLVLLRTYGGWWAVLAFFLSGGWLGWGALTGEPLISIGDGVEWKNLFLAVFLTQRGFLFALPAGLFLLQTFERHLQSFDQPESERRLLGERAVAFGLLWGILPWFHLHVFVVISLILATLAFVYGGIKSMRGIRGLFQSRFFAVAVLPATWLILYSTDYLQKASIAHWNWGWSYDGKGSFIGFLNFNFGPWLFLPLVIAAALISDRPKLPPIRRRQLAKEFTVAFGLFLLFFNLMLAPWPWDNIKILIWPYLWMVRIAYLIFDEFLNDWIRAGLALVLGLSGFMVLAWSIQAPTTRASNIFLFADVANVEGSIKSVPIDAVFAAAPTHDHPLAYLGRVRALGYLGHLWSHGINSSLTEDKQTKIMNGEVDWRRLAHEIGVTHIYWGPAERLRYGDHDRVWMHLLENVSPVKGYEVYSVASVDHPVMAIGPIAPTPSPSPTPEEKK